eukprot:3973585-Amphidinium_carterae.2
MSDPVYLMAGPWPFSRCQHAPPDNGCDNQVSVREVAISRGPFTLILFGIWPSNHHHNGNVNASWRA